MHIGAMLAAYAGVLIALGDKAHNASLQWALTASALILIGVAIQALNASVRRGIRERHVPLVQHRFGMQLRIIGQQRPDVFDGAADADRIAVIDVPRNEMRGNLFLFAGLEKSR